MTMFLIVVYQMYFKSNQHPSQFKSNEFNEPIRQLIQELKEEAEETSCNPILKSGAKSQFYVKIDGETYPKLVPSYFNKSINFACLNKKKKIKKILLWNDFGPWKDFKYGLGAIDPFVKRKCPVTRCEITINKKELLNSDLVVIHMRGSFKRVPKIPRTSMSPRWLFFMMEPPIYSMPFEHFNGKFNLTATYKFDSDFFPYYYANIGFEWGLNTEFNEKFDYLANKTKFATILGNFSILLRKFT